MIQLPDLSKFTTELAKLAPDCFIRYWVDKGILRGFTVEINLAEWHDVLDTYVERCFDEAKIEGFIYDGTSHDCEAKSKGKEFRREWHFYTVEKAPYSDYKPLQPGTYWSEPHGRYIERNDPEWSGCDYDRVVGA